MHTLVIISTYFVIILQHNLFITRGIKTLRKTNVPTWEAINIICLNKRISDVFEPFPPGLRFSSRLYFIA